MKFSAAPVILTLAAALVAHADFFHNDFLPVGHARTDAIINPDCLSEHVHTFYGPPLLHPILTFEDLRKSDPSLSSGNIEENNSLYWHPAVYHVANDGTKTLQESEMTTVYYNWIPGETTAFPPHFRMFTPGKDVFDEEIMSSEREMELSINFPSCWDGVNLDSPDHMSHVAFPEGERLNSPCPSSHPVRIPQLDFFIRWFNTEPARWRFSDDSLRFHADYVSGWDESFLQSLLDGGDSGVDSKVTFCAGIKHEGDDQKLIKQMNDNAVPRADTSCITTEIINNVINFPRGACTGTLISPIGVCDGPSAPTPTAPSTTTPTITAPTPTVATTAPTTAALTPRPPLCQDSNLKFKHGKKSRKFTCSWVAKRSKRCKSKSHASHCPSLCKKCDEFGCENSKIYFHVWSDDHAEMISGKCRDLLEEDADLCGNPVFAQTCRKSCGYCE